MNLLLSSFVIEPGAGVSSVCAGMISASRIFNVLSLILMNVPGHGLSALILFIIS